MLAMLAVLLAPSVLGTLGVGGGRDLSPAGPKARPLSAEWLEPSITRSTRWNIDSMKRCPVQRRFSIINQLSQRFRRNFKLFFRKCEHMIEYGDIDMNVIKIPDVLQFESI